MEAPLDWEPEHGYGKCSVADHIRRDIVKHAEEVAATEEEHKKIEEANRLRALGEEPAGSPGKKAAASPKKKKK